MRMVDIKGAYLNGTLKEDVYIKQPPGFDDGTGRVLKLNWTIYSLKQSGREWNNELDATLKKLGFTLLLADQCVYFRRENSELAILGIHVDDITICANNLDLITCTENELEAHYKITRLGDAPKLLGMEIM